MRPNTSINLLIKSIFHRKGFCTISGSTRSVAMVISGKSVIKFVSKTCLGSKGRKFNKREAPAMLNIFPKLALLAMKTYFKVLANVILPSFVKNQGQSRCKNEQVHQRGIKLSQ